MAHGGDVVTHKDLWLLIRKILAHRGDVVLVECILFRCDGSLVALQTAQQGCGVGAASVPSFLRRPRRVPKSEPPFFGLEATPFTNLATPGSVPGLRTFRTVQKRSSSATLLLRQWSRVRMHHQSHW